MVKEKMEHNSSIDIHCGRLMADKTGPWLSDMTDREEGPIERATRVGAMLTSFNKIMLDIDMAAVLDTV